MDRRFVLLFALLCLTSPLASGQTLEHSLRSMETQQLLQEVRDNGDAARGAVLFHQASPGCARCHRMEQTAAETAPGPDLVNWPKRPSDEYLLNAILDPSRDIRAGYESVQLLTIEGKVVNGLLAEETDDAVSLRDLGTGRVISVAREDIDERIPSSTSIMPAGLVNQLQNRQQFLDLVKYLQAVRDGGPAVAQQLQPSPSQLLQALPEYESRLDHAGLIQELDDDAYTAGRKIYQRLCINCHGDHDKPGSLPTALRFAEGRFRNGSDPYSMYRTLTHGFGFMVAQRWMVPRQKYAVIHYIREAYLKEDNPEQYFHADTQYLADLPVGTDRGPEPSSVERWASMDYGPRLINTYETGADGSNFAYKGIAVRLDAGDGGVARGSSWMILDHDTMRMTAAWTADGENAGGDRFIDWNGIHFNGRHGVHPRLVGDVQVSNPTGPGWAHPQTGSLTDRGRVEGRDGRFYGPLPRDWVKYHGLYAAGQRTIVDYSVGTTRILEMPGLLTDASDRARSHDATFTRTFRVGPRDTELTVLVGTVPDQPTELKVDESTARLSYSTAKSAQVSDETPTWLECSASDFDMTSQDFSIEAEIRTTEDGTLLSRTASGDTWVPDGKALFIRGGHVCYDIGWVGVVESEHAVDDGRPHHVVLSWDHRSGKASLFVDGRLSASKELRPEGKVTGHVVRVGYGARNFPADSLFSGEINRLVFRQRQFDPANRAAQADETSVIASWRPTRRRADGSVVDESGNNRVLIQRGGPQSQRLEAGISPAVPGASWSSDQGQLRLTLPAGQAPLDFVVWFRRSTGPATAAPKLPPVVRLDQLRNTGTRQWQETLATRIRTTTEDGAWAIDHLLPPEDNPWLAQTRLTGLDFFADGDRMAVCSWDGDVWLVTGLQQAQQNGTLKWQRIASGLFQPLGLRIVDGQICVGCRDQLVILEDHNGDGETDYYRCLNNDHQVTEHFHEFAMGLQTDAAGNWYYAKSARHALPAVVPHHGTLLRVSPTGKKTEILATGFRAANGVCLNPDGTFVVTDQEGHWNPKNRINWVREGGFYGNMYGYHDVTDSSDDAMEPPLCWITNSFDRSPGELLWVNSPSWGALNGSLLNLSYGYGKIYVVPFEQTGSDQQGGMCELPIPQFPTGVMRGRFHPGDGHLYACGMFAWAGSRQHPGGLYRMRATGNPAWLPVGLNARSDGMSIRLSDSVDIDRAGDPDRYQVKAWSLRRTAKYGSDHYNERVWPVSEVRVSADGRQLHLQIPDLEPTWCMEIRCRLPVADGEDQERVIHNTVHQLAR